MKNRVIWLLKNLLRLFFIFPIKPNRIIFISYSGKQYSCNPKYIFENLLKNKVELEYVWTFCNPNDFSFMDKRVKKVRYKSLSYLYYTLTARIVVENAEGWSILPKRKGQIVINTWHGGGAYKGVGLNRRDTSKAEDRNMLEKHQRVSLYLSSSRAFTEMTRRKSFGYSGEVLECGMPRNDILIHSDSNDKERIKRKLKLCEDERYILYAPTFRNVLGYEANVDFEGVVRALEQRFSGKWRVLYRHHYYVSDNYSNNKLIDVSTVPDMQELLLVADALLTDYSSSIWDFSFTGRPGFLFVPDLQDYLKEERSFYTPIESWPYEYACTNHDLFELIKSYDELAAKRRIQSHHIMLESFESGIATNIVCEYIKNSLEEKAM